MRGKFITFEGSEGCGKSTQSRLLYKYLKNKGYQVVYLRQPGGTRVGEKIRGILLDPKNHITPPCETLLYLASRAQALREIILPALREAKTVICDRFLDSTLVYQGYGLGIDIDFIKKVGDLVSEGIRPDLTILLDLLVKKGHKFGKLKKDRIEQRSFSYHQRVRRGYLKIARQEPKRVKVVKVDKDKAVTQEKIRKLVLCYLKR